LVSGTPTDRARHRGLIDDALARRRSLGCAAAGRAEADERAPVDADRRVGRGTRLIGTGVRSVTGVAEVDEPDVVRCRAR
jgi:hypothetical protein